MLRGLNYCGNHRTHTSNHENAAFTFACNAYVYTLYFYIFFGGGLVVEQVVTHPHAAAKFQEEYNFKVDGVPTIVVFKPKPDGSRPERIIYKCGNRLILSLSLGVVYRNPCTTYTHLYIPPKYIYIIYTPYHFSFLFVK